MNAEHDGEKFLLQEELRGAHAILRLQQPPATALLDVVQRIARRALHDLQQVGLRVEGHNLAERTGGRFADEAGRRHRRYGTIRDLEEGAACARAIAQEHTDPEHALTSDGGHFHEPSVAHRIRHGKDAPVREIDVLDGLLVFLQGAADDRGIHPQMRTNAGISPLKKQKEAILQAGAIGEDASRPYGSAGHAISSERT
jgi:hypothetical protein